MSYHNPGRTLRSNTKNATNIENELEKTRIKLENDCYSTIVENRVTVKEEIEQYDINSLLTPIETPSTSSFHRSPEEHDSILKSLVENIQQDIKKEIEASENAGNVFTNAEDDLPSSSNQQDNEQYNALEHQVKVESYNDNNLDISKDNRTQLNKDSTNMEELVNVKEENVEDNSIVSYDFPQFDSTSIDSSEGGAMGHVEACLQEDQDIRSEKYNHYNLKQHKKTFEICQVKLEPDLTVTETHLISNKLINTTSTVTHPQDGVIESQTTRTLVMEILPVNMGSNNMSLTKLSGNPEEILPTTENKFDDTFQLNSITGDCPPLEAYGLLNTKKQKKIKRKNMYYCTKCPKVCTNSYSFKRHAKVHDTIERYKMGRIRGKLTRKENQLKKEQESELKEKVEEDDSEKKESYKCTCGKEFGRRTRMESCLRSHSDCLDVSCYSCITCSKEFKHKEELMLHRKRLHRKKFPCKFCPTDYNTRKELFRHLRKHQKVQLMEFKVISELEGNQKLKCFMCSKTFNGLPNLKTHIMSDHKAPYKCAECKQKFNKMEEFATHTKTSHPDIKGLLVLDVLEAFSKLAQAWKCEECNLQFNQADELAMHQVESHAKEVKVSTESEQHQCIDCRRVFASHKSLNSHRRVHHSSDNIEETATVEQGLLCVYCRKVCKDENALTSHMRFHSSDRKYVCKFCDFRFATLEKRKTHAEIHTGDMRYVCFICEYTCSSENRLKSHKMSVKHLSMKEYLLTGKPIETLTPKEEKIKETLKEKESDTKKKKLSNEGEPSHSSTKSSCDVCGKKFSTEKKMLHHKLTHPFIEFPNEEQPSRIFFK